MLKLGARKINRKRERKKEEELFYTLLSLSSFRSTSLPSSAHTHAHEHTHIRKHTHECKPFLNSTPEVSLIVLPGCRQGGGEGGGDVFIWVCCRDISIGFQLSFHFFRKRTLQQNKPQQPASSLLTSLHLIMFLVWLVLFCYLFCYIFFQRVDHLSI